MTFKYRKKTLEHYQQKHKLFDRTIARINRDIRETYLALYMIRVQRRTIRLDYCILSLATRHCKTLIFSTESLLLRDWNVTVWIVSSIILVIRFRFVLVCVTKERLSSLRSSISVLKSSVFCKTTSRVSRDTCSQSSMIKWLIFAIARIKKKSLRIRIKSIKKKRAKMWKRILRA